MKELTHEQGKALMGFIKKTTGAKLVLLVLGENEIPCEEEKNGKECDGHNTTVMSCGIETVGYLGGVAHNLLEKVEMGILDFEDTNTDNY